MYHVNVIKLKKILNQDGTQAEQTGSFEDNEFYVFNNFLKATLFQVDAYI